MKHTHRSLALLVAALTLAACTPTPVPAPSDEFPDSTQAEQAPSPDPIDQSLSDFPTPMQLLLKSTDGRVYTPLSEALSARGYALYNFRLALRELWADYYHKHDWDTRHNIDCYHVGGEGLEQQCLVLSFDEGNFDVLTPATVVNELRERLTTQPEALASLNEADRITELNRMITESGYDITQACTALRNVWRFRRNTEMEDDLPRSNYRQLYFDAYDPNVAPSEGDAPRLLQITLGDGGDVIGTAFITQGIAPTVPENAAQWLALEDLDREKYLYRAIKLLYPDDAPFYKLRTLWADDYLGYKNGVDYYLTGEKTNDQVLSKIVGIRTASSRIEIALRGAYDASAGLPPVELLNVADAAAWGDDAAKNLVTLFPKNTRTRLCALWKDHLIDFALDRDVYSIGDASAFDKLNNRTIDVLTVIYHEDDTIADVIVESRGAAPTVSHQTVLDLYLHKGASITASDLSLCGEMMGYTDYRLCLLLREVLSEYYVGTETLHRRLTIDRFRLPDATPDEPTLWIEYLAGNNMRIGVGEYSETIIMH